MSVELQRKPIVLTAWHLVEPADMIAALGDLAAQGWRGGINQDGSDWRLELNADNPTRQIVATLGDWLVDDLGLRLLSDDDVQANYEEQQ